ncbi:MAG TPA: PadR family transcriptional regulator [Acidimicrobiales bacterium]|nr:PadR family transcriptional regulator [Acidimicrobiales bacterium]
MRLHVLHHAAAGEVSGVWLSEELAHHGYRISPGTLYPLLHALEADGLLESRQLTENGRVLRYYQATREGRATLAAARSALADLAGELLTEDTPAAPTPRGRSESAHA